MTRKNNSVNVKYKDIKMTKSLTNNDKITQSSICNWKLITLIMSIFVAFISIIYAYYSKFSLIHLNNTVHINEGGWINDKIFEKESADVGCDIPIIHYDKINWNKLNKDELISSPFIMKGLIDGKWTAKNKWTRSNFKKYYGDKKVKTGSESSIVYSAGSVYNSTPISIFLDNLKVYAENIDMIEYANTNDIFTFDVSIMDNIPSLLEDFSIPKIFSNWHNTKTNTNNAHNDRTWFMLSLGSSRAGLPYHSHGKTWLGLVYGKKRWFIYPPGYDQPNYLYLYQNPLGSVYEWYNDIFLKYIKHLPLPPSILPRNHDKNEDNNAYIDENNGFRPFQCVQHAGDVLFLPSGYNHLTMNIGEAIGIGGQESWMAKNRLTCCRSILSLSPYHLLNNKDTGVALAHLGLEELTLINHNLKKTNTGLIELTSINFDNLVSSSEDNWIIFYHNHIKLPYHFFKLFGIITDTLKGKYSVGAMSIVASIKDEIINYDKNIVLKFNIPIDNFYTNDIEFILAIYPYKNTIGYNDRKKDVIFYLKGSIGITLNFLKMGDNDRIKQMLGNIGSYLLNYHSDNSLVSGCINTIPVKVERLYNEAQFYLKRALQIYPLHPEIRGLLIELYKYQNNTIEMIKLMEESIQLYDSLSQTRRISTFSLSSLYHNFATIYLASNMPHDALKILNKAININHHYTPALSDREIALYLSGHYKNNENEVFHKLTTKYKLESNHPIIRKLINEMMQKKITL